MIGRVALEGERDRPLAGERLPIVDARLVGNGFRVDHREALDDAERFRVEVAAPHLAHVPVVRRLDDQCFVELDQITPDNVDRLQPAWVFATGGDNRGLEATPLLHEGVLYLSADESRVFAIDARTGARKWSYEPRMPDDAERVYCCGSNNRGVALFGGLVYVGTMNARLIALDRRSTRCRRRHGARLPFSVAIWPNLNSSSATRRMGTSGMAKRWAWTI